MDTREFQTWQQQTRLSTYAWVIDEVTLHNRGAYLMYQGGESGVYILIENGAVEIGTYVGAVPHIGEAMFTSFYTFEQKFSNNEKALTWIVSYTQRAFFLELLRRFCRAENVPDWLLPIWKIALELI